MDVCDTAKRQHPLNVNMSLMFLKICSDPYVCLASKQARIRVAVRPKFRTYYITIAQHRTGVGNVPLTNRQTSAQ